MTVETTSIKAYHETTTERQRQREIIYNFVSLAKHPSNADITRFTGLPRASVCGRLRELELDGRICKAGTKLDPFTRKTVKWYAPVAEGSE